VKNAVAVVLGLLLAGASLAADPPKATPEEKGPRINIDPLLFDFGKAVQNKTLTKEFVLKNFGNEDLVIDRVSTTCGCTIASGYDKLVKPGGSTTLRVTLETRSYSGRVERKVAVKSNDQKQGLAEVTVVAFVEPEKAAQD
jgi:hypothetical protein